MSVPFDGNERAAEALEPLLFDVNPIHVGGFLFLGRCAAPEPGKSPTLADWTDAFRLACAAEESSPYWIGDLMNYAENRADWRARLDQATSIGGYARHTLLNRAYISRHVTGKARDVSPSLAHSEKVAPLPPEEQVDILAEARVEGWTARELGTRVKARSRVQTTQAPTMHTVDVVVRVALEAELPALAEDLAWTRVKDAIAGMRHAHVISAHAQPHVGPRLLKKRSA
jgi:hypothetical protein